MGFDTRAGAATHPQKVGAPAATHPHRRWALRRLLTPQRWALRRLLTPRTGGQRVSEPPVSARTARAASRAPRARGTANGRRGRDPPDGRSAPSRVAPVFAAHSQVEVRTHRPSLLAGHPDQPTHPGDIDGFERGHPEDSSLQVGREEVRLDVVAAEPHVSGSGRWCRTRRTEPPRRSGRPSGPHGEVLIIVPMGNVSVQPWASATSRRTPAASSMTSSSSVPIPPAGS